MTIEPNDPTRAGTLLADAILPGARLSRNEVESLCMKAARGAGMSWGHAEEAGRAADWLVVQGVDGPAALLAQLARAEGKPWSLLAPRVAAGHWRSAAEYPLCPIAVGAALTDFSGLGEGLTEGRTLTVGPVSIPVLLLAFLCDLAEQADRSIVLDWVGGRVGVGPDGIESGEVRSLFETSEAILVLSMMPRHSGAGPVSTRCMTSLHCLKALDALAMKITVPPSEKSRTGAGSATSDND